MRAKRDGTVEAPILQLGAGCGKTSALLKSWVGEEEQTCRGGVRMCSAGRGQGVNAGRGYIGRTRLVLTGGPMGGIEKNAS